MEQLILIAHVLIAIAIVGLILIQQGKGADMGASFGSGGSQTLFGSGGGGSVLTRATAILATLFFTTSLGLAWVAKQRTVVDEDYIPVPAVEESREVAPAMDDELPSYNEAAQEEEMPQFPE